MADQTTVTADPKVEAAVDPKAGAVAIPAAGAAAATEPTEDYVVEGKVYKLTKAQAKAAVQKGLFADKRLKSVDVLTKNAQALVNALKTDPFSVLRDPALGISEDDLLERILASDASDATKERLSKWVYDNVVAQAKKTPEEIERDKKLTDYERMKKAEADRKTKEESAAKKAEIQQIYAGVRAEVVKQITADKTFPQVEGSIRAVFDKLRAMNKQGAPLTTENVTKALALVKKDHVMHQQALFDAIEDPEALIALFGEERALKISRALVKRIQNKQKTPAKDEKAIETDGPRKKITQIQDEKRGVNKHGYHIMEL